MIEVQIVDNDPHVCWLEHIQIHTHLRERSHKHTHTQTLRTHTLFWLSKWMAESGTYTRRMFADGRHLFHFYRSRYSITIILNVNVWCFFCFVLLLQLFFGIIEIVYVRTNHQKLWRIVAKLDNLSGSIHWNCKFCFKYTLPI